MAVDLRARFARAQLARREGLLQDAPLVRGPGAEAHLRALGLLGEVRLLGRGGDIVIIGSTGLVLWFPNFFCSFLPGVTLNIAKVIHSTQALLATGFVFAIHFFSIHLRPEKFPADMSLLIGLVSEEEFRDERPELFERLQAAGLTWSRCGRRCRPEAACGW